MVREDILGGLRLALSKGQSLPNAMQSFYNAGYQKEEIEEAARALASTIAQQNYQQSIQQPIQKLVQAPKQAFQPPPNLVKKPPMIIQSPPPISQKRIEAQQVVSSYQEPKQRRVDFVTVILVVILVLLLGALVSVFFFKPQIVEFLNKYLE